jgi:hypothetical protein
LALFASYIKPSFSLTSCLQLKSFDISDAEAHHTLILLGLLGSEFANRMTATQLTFAPTGLTALIG